MKTNKSNLFAACCLTLFSLTARADYTVNFVQGYNAFANHLDHPGGNRAGLLFPNPQDQMRILKWDGRAFSIYTYDAGFGSWDPSEPVVDPGEGAFLYAPTAFSNTFTGAAHTPSLPVEMVPGQMYFLSDQTAQVGSWDSIVGTPPIEGSQVFLYNVASSSSITNYDVYTFRQGAWQPSTPSIPIGVSAFFSSPLLASGWVTRQFYLDVNTNNAGGGVADLLADAKFPNNPNITDVAPGFRINNDIAADNYGARIQAYFTPSTSGFYEFFIYNDDAAQLFLSTDSFEANLQPLINSPSLRPTFDASVMGTSPSLTAGKAYLLRALFRQNTGVAQLGVAVRLQGDSTPPASLPVLGGNQISTIVYPPEGANITFLQQPADANSSTGGRAKFTVSVTSAGPQLYYQWLSNGVTIPNANRTSYATPALSTNDNGNVYQVQVSAGGQTILSGPAYLGVVPGILPRVQPYVGINFLSGEIGTVSHEVAGLLETNDVAGFVAQENFNNLAKLSANGVPLQDSHGAPSPVTVSYGPVLHEAAGTGPYDAEHALFQGYIQDGNNPITITLSNMPPTTNYSLLVYSVGVSTNTTYEEAFALTGQIAYPTLHVRAQDANQYLAAPAYARMSSTDPNHRDSGNYVQFDNVSPAADGTLKLVVTPEANSPGPAILAPVSALQLVTVQPPPVVPSLTMSHVAVSNLLTIAWDATAAGYALETTPALGVDARWTPVLGISTPITNGSSVSVSTTSSSTRFYGLIQKGYPFIIQQPQSQIVQFGTPNVSFSVIVTGAPPITYQWTFNNANIPFATNATYTITTPVDFTNVGDYRVFINDPLGSLPAGLSVYSIGVSGGALETPISRFVNGTFTCPSGGPAYNRTYTPRDTLNNAYLFYGPNASLPTGIFVNTQARPRLSVNAVSSVNSPVQFIAVELQNNFWPVNPPIRCGLQPPQFTLSTQAGTVAAGSKNSYAITAIYQSPPAPTSLKVRFNWEYQP